MGDPHLSPHCRSVCLLVGRRIPILPRWNILSWENSLIEDILSLWHLWIKSRLNYKSIQFYGSKSVTEKSLCGIENFHNLGTDQNLILQLSIDPNDQSKMMWQNSLNRMAGLTVAACVSRVLKFCHLSLLTAEVKPFWEIEIFNLLCTSWINILGSWPSLWTFQDMKYF